jgi:antitoxin YefM
MDSISYTSARTNLAQIMDQVCDNHTPVRITRKSKSAVVMISLVDYQALEETAYLLHYRKNTKRLIEAISELDKNNGRLS